MLFSNVRRVDPLLGIVAIILSGLRAAKKGWPRLQIETTASNKMKHGAQRWTAFIVSGDFALIHIGAE
jgi:hypothetical protein